MKTVRTVFEALLARLAYMLQSPLLLVIRLYWGFSFVQTGWGKWTHLEKTTQYFADLGLPAPHLNAMAAGTVELVGGALLFLGLFSRFACVPLIFTMIVAFVTGDRDAVHTIFSDPDKFTGAAPFLFLFACLVVFAFGPGRYSLDEWRARRAARATENASA